MGDLLKRLKFSRQPVAWVTVLVLIGQAYLDATDGNGFDMEGWGQRILIALGGAVAWTQVTPVKQANLPAIRQHIADGSYRQDLP